LKKRASLNLNTMVRTAGALLVMLFLFAGCEEDKIEGPSGPEHVAWTQHDPLLEGNKLQAATFVDENEGWIVGKEGVVLHTSDGGNSWSSQHVVNENLWDITFFDGDTGWAVGENGTLLWTIDGGLSWPATLFDTISDDIYSVVFEDGHSCWAVGTNGTILRTTDAGRSWSREITSGTGQTLRGVAVAGMVALAVGDAGIVMRTFGSVEVHTEWSAQTIDTNNLWAVTLIDEASGWAVGENGAIWITTDSGNTWSEQTSNVSETLTDVVFASATTGLIVGSSGMILSTTDGGDNWVVDTSATWHDLFGVCLAGQNDAWAVGSLTLLHSTNSGNSWVPKPSGTVSHADLIDIMFYNEALGWAVGKGGVIMKTTDGGDTWEYQRRDKILSESQEWFSNVKFVDSLQGWCVGGTGVFPFNGVLLHTSDGGRNWSTQAFDTTQETEWLYGITFVDSLTGWAVGGDWSGNVGGAIFKTIDGGLTWNSLTIPIIAKLEAVTFVNSLHGWAVGFDRTILHTTDGGITWTYPTTEESYLPHLYSVAATDSLHCWAVGANGSIFHTNDGSDSAWVKQVSPTDQDLTAVTFVNSSTGWSVGAGGVIIRTSDGGSTWSTQSSGTVNTLNGVTFLGANNGWIVGDRFAGRPITILSTTTGGE